MTMNYTLNIRGRLMSLSEPRVMGILNATPDSFFAQSRAQTEQQIALRARQIVDEGGAFIDVGACSTRPGSTPVGEQEEMERLRLALTIVRREQPQAVVSVDTFRPAVARMAVEELGADIINDVGSPDEQQRKDMHRMVARLGVPYILMAAQPTLRQTLLALADEVQQLRNMGHKDIIIDPGFGFGKTMEQNYALLNQLEKLQVLQLPVLVGVSRKSMIWRLLDTTPEQALNGTTALHAVALTKGASVLRVHDVREAVECCRLMKQLSAVTSCRDVVIT
jgi:dihydropteroate synthase